MTAMNGLRFEILWLDEHIAEVCIEAGNGRFAGTAKWYEPHDWAARLAATVRGFPTSPADRRELRLGELDPAASQTGSHIVMQGSGGRGYVSVEITILCEHERASFAFETDPASIDRWVRALDALPNEVGATVSLPSTS
jgi:hypothetical protein